MRKYLFLAITILFLSCSYNSEIKNFLEERTNKVVNVIEVSEKRNYITREGWDNGKNDIQESVYSYRVKYSVGDNIFYDDVIFEKDTNKPIMLSSEVSK